MDDKKQINKIVNALKALTIDEIEKLINSINKSIEENNKNKLLNFQDRDKKYKIILNLIETEINKRLN